MSWLALVPVFLNALVAIPKIGTQVEAAVAQAVAWYVGRQNTKTLGLIADAAAAAARAQTDDDRYAAAALWQSALSRPRYSA